MIALQALLRQVVLDEAELLGWIDSGWVRPESRQGDWLFDEIDVARVQLIIELRRDCAIDDDAVPLVLSLLDQIYGLRGEVAALCRAIAAQPDGARAAIMASLREGGGAAALDGGTAEAH
jgi:chaperone modulatory protein CbpM